jgi:hypothetical protein
MFRHALAAAGRKLILAAAAFGAGAALGLTPAAALITAAPAVHDVSYLRPAVAVHYPPAAPEPSPWQHVRAYCHRTRLCVRPSGELRRDLGIRPAALAWERPEDDTAGRMSTFVWVRQPGGAVRGRLDAARIR